ncbi:MAG: TraR/DksA C4-type zinc finger protein [Spirochaetales bacterium]|nr:TraR/DksA C4-type zinc finger protein [Spirochaetales bacterium]
MDLLYAVLIILLQKIKNREYRISINNITYSILYDPEISIEYNIGKLQKKLGIKIGLITYTVNLKDIGHKTYISRRLIKQCIEDGELKKEDFRGAFNRRSKKYVEITKFAVTSQKESDNKSVIGKNPNLTYCRRCGEIIPEERLRALPNTKTCVLCLNEVQNTNPRKRKKMKDDSIAGSREDVKRGRARSWGDH